MPNPLIDGQSIRKAYGLQVVLEDLSFLITEKQKIALIGRNGAGKSTFLKILIGDEEADGGKVHFYPDVRLGIVKQHEILPNDVTTLGFLETSAEKPEWEVRKLSAQFGLSSEHLDLPPASLSGGYQMRVKLVAMLLHDPNLLILDEPVNYLDLHTLLFLERFLQNYRGAFIVAAHDRTFLQNTCTHTFEIEYGRLTSYRGPITEYFEFKQEQLELVQSNNKRLAREMAHTQKFVDRFRYKASLATRAQSKLKHIGKLRRQIVAIDTSLAVTRIRIPCPPIVPGTAVRTRELSIGYGEVVVAKNINLEIQRGDKVVIAGENGRGKSTLLKTLAGRIPALDGGFTWYKGNIGYYDQLTHKTLVESETVLQYLTRLAPAHVSGEGILMMAGNFLFRNDDLDKPTGVLSGGERARLCLAGLLLHEHNTLILDEPTNHLDVETTEALALALKNFAGTVIIVSHARTFVDTLIDTIYEVRAGMVRRYMGTYEEYIDDLSALMETNSIAQPATPSASSLPAHQRAEIHTRIKEYQRSQERLNTQITTLDKEKSAILAYFFENPTDYSPPKSQRLAELDELLADKERQWLNDQEAIDLLRKELAS